ncbi:MAG TPA: malto-oligosyltrehalose trehalohydrolase [Acidimicrobiales bacterium]|nr:malto-oligosyltrehalose trehalohydrolase [Acidimicrobiales bacterium]
MGHRFSVWAPRPDRVDVVVGARHLPMSRSGGGWWQAVVDDAGAGSRYGFSLDGGPTRPDPRSLSQPDGIDGLSEVVDHGAYRWGDRGWRGVPLPGAVLYELHIGTFTRAGTFDAAIEGLEHLVSLGVNALEVMPVAEFSGARGWGNDGADLFAPHHSYGGPDGLKAFVDACHDAGLAVVLDVVYNHLGPAGNHLAEYGPYFSERHQTNWGAAVNFDGPGSVEVRRFIVDNALMWLGDYHCDGLRLDAVHAIVDESARHILEELSDEVGVLAAGAGRPLYLVAESDLNDPRLVRPPDLGGLGIDAAWADDWHHALHAALSGDRSGYYEDFGSLELLAKALRQAWAYDGQWSTHRQMNHGRAPEGLRGYQFVVFTQNHDQIGNRAIGERSSSLMSEGRLRIAAALLLTGPFTPMLFQGEEWGATSPFQYFTDHRDTDLGRAVSDGRRSEFVSFGWDPSQVPDPQAETTFEASKLRWDECAKAPHDGLLAWYQQLIGWRRRLRALADPRLSSVQVDVDEAAGTLVVHRAGIDIVVNLGAGPASFTVPPGSVVLAGSGPGVRLAGGRLILPVDAVAVVEVGR